MSKNIFISFTATLFLIAVGCGIRNSSYVDYTEESQSEGATTAPPTTNTTTECTDGADAYLAGLSNTIDNTCATSSCHGSSSIAGKTLTPGEHATNRSTLLDFESDSESNLFDKIALQNNKSHAGGDFSSSLTKESIDTWKAGEAKCAN